MVTVHAALIAMVLGAPAQQTPVQELGNLFVGRWIGDVTLIADWPGTGKRGEKVTGYWSCRWIVDGEAFEAEWFGGTGHGKSMFTWDAAAKVVRETGVAAGGGGAWQATWKKKGKQWVSMPHRNSLADGTKITGGRMLVTPEDGGKTLVFTNNGQGVVGDKKMDPLHDVYTKLADTVPTNEVLEEYGNQFAGRWVGDIELVRDWPGIGKKGDKIVAHTTYEWIAGRRALLQRWRGGEGAGQALYGWDPIEKKIRQTNIGSSGTSYVVLISKEGDHWAWTLTGCFADGTKMTGKGTTKFTEPNRKYEIAGDLVVGGQPVSFVDPYTRVDK